MIHLFNINLKVNNRTLLNNEELTLNKGRIYAITGKSGSGKTTLLYELSLLSNLSGCDYYWNNEYVNSYSNDQKDELRRNNIGYVLQNLEIISENLTMKQNLECMYYLSGQIYSEQKVNEYLSILNLNMKLTQNMDNLSKGERQRFAILMALIKNVDVIVLDEPTSALDISNSKELMVYLNKIAREYNKIIVIATHDSIVIEQADIIYKIENCHLICDNELEKNNICCENKEVNKFNKQFFDVYKKANYRFSTSILNLVSIFVTVLLCLAPVLLNRMINTQQELYSLIKSNEIIVVNSDQKYPYGTYLDNVLPLSDNEIGVFSQIKNVESVNYYWELDGLMLNQNKNYNVKILAKNGIDQIILPTKFKTLVIDNILFEGQVIVDEVQNNIIIEISDYIFKDIPHTLYNNVDIVYIPSSKLESYLNDEGIKQSASVSIVCEDENQIEEVINEISRWFPNATITSLGMDKLYDIAILETISNYIIVVKIILLFVTTLIFYVLQSMLSNIRNKEIGNLRINGFTRKMGYLLNYYESINVVIIAALISVIGYVILVVEFDMYFSLINLFKISVQAIVFSIITNGIPNVLGMNRLFNKDISFILRNN